MSHELEPSVGLENSVVDDRRKDERRPPELDPTYLWISMDKRIRARLVDESEGGIGLLVPIAFEVGFRVRVDHRLGRRMAKVAHVSEVENGCYRLGLHWLD